MKNENKGYIKTNVVDVHSHILPNMDDGSRSVEESLELLSDAYRQGIGTIIATPHFYGDRESPDSFLARRQAAVKTLKAAIAAQSEPMPAIYLGAEIAYYFGIGSSEALTELCIEGTRCALIEMPFCAWSRSEVDEIYAAMKNFGITPILAHIERFIGYGKNLKYLKEFASRDVLLQCNAEFFTEKRTRKKALKFLKSGFVKLLGSDCHNTTSRRQTTGDAINIIREELSDEYINNIEDHSESVLFTAVPV